MAVISSDRIDNANRRCADNCSILTYSAGAQYEGDVRDCRAYGFGRFTWANQETFEGFCVNGRRTGVGVQRWPDGDEYSGQFLEDRMHGWGRYRWANGDTYEGAFWKDCKHGFGQYTCTDGRSYHGTFYMNRKEGFGKAYSGPKGNIFMGLYKDNYRCGPGIMIYADGRHDIGLWYRNNLLKLVDSAKEVFSINIFSSVLDMYKMERSSSFYNLQRISANDLPTTYSLDRSLTYRLKKPLSMALLEFKEEIGIMDKEKTKSSVIENDVDTQFLTTNDSMHSLLTDAMKFVEIPLLTVDAIKFDQAFDPHDDESLKEYFKFDENFELFLSKIIVPNTLTPLMKKIIDHIHRFSKWLPIDIQSDCGHNLSDVMTDVLSSIFKFCEPKPYFDRRDKYSSPGEFELLSQELIAASHVGNLNGVKRLLNSPIPPNVNVTDSVGSFSLLEATLTWNTDLINYLLDYGANINQITDEGITAIGACFLFYYPDKNFVKTIAEDVVRLNQTPLNFNGVRKENTKLVAEKGEASNQQELESIHREMWNEYQKYLISDLLDDSVLDFENDSKADSDGFESYRNCISYPFRVTDKLIEKAASVLSSNSKMIERQPRPNSRFQKLSEDEGAARFRALQISRNNMMVDVIKLLLSRGASPNICEVPFPAIFFAIKCSDVEMTKLLISKGADVNSLLKPDTKSIRPLHIACCLPGKCAVYITDLLLKSGADPNYRSYEDDSFLDKTLIDEWSRDDLSEEQEALIGGKSPLHLVCSRYDNFKISHQVAKLLLDNGAEPNFICNGHTALTLAIASGNDLIVDELLSRANVKVNLSLTHGVGNALCVATSTAFEHIRPIEGRLNLLKKLINAKADPVSPVLVGFRRQQGIAVDYSYHIFNMDQRVSHLPYHALTSIERELFNNRKNVLSHMGMFTREKAVEIEKQRLESFKEEGVLSRGPSPDFVYTGAGADIETASILSKKKSTDRHISVDALIEGAELLARKPLFKYCYECGRSLNVKLTSCTRCREVFFCSKLCKTKAWTSRHKNECLRLKGRTSSAESELKSNRNTDSPTPTVMADDVNPGNVTKFPNYDLVKRQMIQKMNKPSDINDSNIFNKPSYIPRKLPPIYFPNHPSFSYAFIAGKYVKTDKAGRIIELANSVDNYSFE